MDKIEKALRKLSSKDRERIKQIILLVQRGNVVSLDIKKLKGRKDIFRIRKGDMRIIFRWLDGKLFILAIERRSEKTYNNF